jgi:glycosyltransferase involved in cell wall biosynthesis
VKILLLSAYAAHSHVHWQRSLLAMFPDWQWQVLSLPPRYFSWRVRGNPLYWSVAERALLERDYDLLLATSMVDLATLRGLVPALTRLPTLLYFHENQFDYPQQGQQSSLLEAQMVSLYSALAANQLLFNSAYNRDSFLVGLAGLLDRLPDRVPLGVVASLRDKAQVLPVPIELEPDASATANWPGRQGERPTRPLRLLWTGRFEHDKGGDQLLLVLQQLDRQGVDYELAMCGQQFRNSPAVFAEIEARFSHRLVHYGYLPSPADYRALLRAADVVLATALHEFQGLAVLEAVASGCLPAVPDRLSYSEIYPAPFRYLSCPDDAAGEAGAAARLVCELAQPGRLQAPDVRAFGLAQLEPRYRALLQGSGRVAG